jgi:hypothetical protein
MDMRLLRIVVVAAALLVPSALYAGQVYGTIVMDGKGVGGASIEIQCGSDPATTGSTGADGAYRINVPQQGQCTISLPSHGKASAMVFSGPNPSAFNFELVKMGEKYELKRR